MDAVQIHRDRDRIRLTGELRFDTVPALLDSSEDWFERGKSLALDLSGVRRSDSAGVALLLEWLRRAHARDCAIHYLAAPQQMHAIIDFCALGDILPLREKASDV